MSTAETIAPPPAALDRGRSRPRTLLITGAGSRMGRLLAARLEREPFFGRIVGADFARPREPEGATWGENPPLRGKIETLAADLLSQDADEVLGAERPEAIAHLLWLPEALDPAAAYRVNVLGTTRLLGAAARAGVRAIVFPSATVVYGASAGNPCFIVEDATARGEEPEAAHKREVERQLEAIGPEVATAILRLAPILGPGAESAFAAYLRPRVVPTALGYDPRVQVLGEEDAIEALAQALLTRFSGTANVAAPGVLPLRRALRLAGRTALPLPHPLLPAALVLHALHDGRPHLRMDAAALRFPPVADTARMEQALGFRPAKDALAVIEGLAAERHFRDDGGSERARIRAMAREARK